MFQGNPGLTVYPYSKYAGPQNLPAPPPGCIACVGCSAVVRVGRNITVVQPCADSTNEPPYILATIARYDTRLYQTEIEPRYRITAIEHQIQVAFTEDNTWKNTTSLHSNRQDYYRVDTVVVKLTLGYLISELSRYLSLELFGIEVALSKEDLPVAGGNDMRAALAGLIIDGCEFTHEEDGQLPHVRVTQNGVGESYYAFTSQRGKHDRWYRVGFNGEPEAFYEIHNEAIEPCVIRVRRYWDAKEGKVKAEIHGFVTAELDALLVSERKEKLAQIGIGDTYGDIVELINNDPLQQIKVRTEHARMVSAENKAKSEAQPNIPKKLGEWITLTKAAVGVIGAIIAILIKQRKK